MRCTGLRVTHQKTELSLWCAPPVRQVPCAICSIGLSPALVKEVFRTLQRLRDQGVTILMVEQNARSALAISDFGIVLELGRTRIHDRAATLLADPRVGQLFLGGHIEAASRDER
jgi:ABC-type sugar transport system ATPase subunit